MTALNHWIARLFRMHTYSTGVNLATEYPTRRQIIAWTCETCGHTWLETRKLETYHALR